jgi:hypothetical protein
MLRCRLGLILVVAFSSSCAPSTPSSNDKATVERAVGAGPAETAEPSDNASTKADAMLADLQAREAAFAEIERKQKDEAERASKDIPVVVEFAPSTANSTAEPARRDDVLTPPTSDVAGGDRPPFDIMSSSFDVTEKNKTWWRFSWQMTIRNQSREPILVSPTVEFQDSRGFQLDTGISRQRVIAGSQTINISDSSLIDADTAPAVAKVFTRVRLLSTK